MTINSLIKYLNKEVLKHESEQYINIIFGETEIIMEVFEDKIPIKIYRKREAVVAEDWSSLHWETRIAAELYAELLDTNISYPYLETLAKICEVIENNPSIFDDLLSKEKYEVMDD